MFVGLGLCVGLDFGSKWRDGGGWSSLAFCRMRLRKKVQ